MIIAILLEITDVADGIIARKYKIVTNFGKLYDPFSDAFCRYTLFLGLFSMGHASLWMLLLIFYRDSSISFFRSIAASQSIVVGARRSGKIKAIVQGVGVQFAFLFIVLDKFLDEPNLLQFPWWIMAVITVITTASFLDYFAGYLPVLRKAWSEKPVKDQ
jgi:CDP-diacylglycerol--glycerol-3-phosphate 3-phosphatidyltransferase